MQAMLQVTVSVLDLISKTWFNDNFISDQESSASEDHESEDDNDGRESFTVNY